MYIKIKYKTNFTALAVLNKMNIHQSYKTLLYTTIFGKGKNNDLH